MNEARIECEFPDLPDELKPVAQLSVVYEMARELEMARGLFEARNAVETEHVSQAQKTMLLSMQDLLKDLSEADLTRGRDSGLLAEDDFKQAVIAKRKMELLRSRPEAQDHERHR